MDDPSAPSNQEGPRPSRRMEPPLDEHASFVNSKPPQLDGADDVSPSCDDDSASDVSMANGSDDDDFYGPPSQTPRGDENAAASGSPQHLDAGDAAQGLPLSRKRKSPDRPGDDGNVDGGATAGNRLGLEQNKKVKLEEDGAEFAPVVGRHLPHDRSILPVEIWHQIFTFCPPKTLGVLMSVNKLFHSCLDPSAHTSSPAQEAAPASGASQLLKPDSIWKASRRLFWPGMPAPLRSKTELDMWKLVCSFSCEFCGKEGVADSSTTAVDSTAAGPGADGVTIVWSFGNRTCGPCLLKNSLKEIDILLSSSTPSALVPAIPFVLVTEKLCVVPSSAIERGQLPRDSQVTKIFAQSGLDAVKQEFFAVRDLGLATAEEWMKGLESRGTELQQDASRWEKYASTGGVSRMRNTLYPGYQPNAAAQLPGASPGQPIPSGNASEPTPRAGVPSSAPPSLTNGTTPTGLASLPPPPVPPGAFRHERTREEVAELKAARKAEIERRSMLLDPPLEPSILAHIPSFQAAMQIVTPLDDDAWELLKPRLVAQRLDAEKREADASLRDGSTGDGKQRHMADASVKDKEVTDSDWDEAQGPLRGRISILADEIIRNNWDSGDSVSKDTCSKFAVDVLLYVRKQFYVEVANNAKAARAAGKRPVVDPPGGPFTQKLTLENMKWIFDTKIRPVTEPLRKELFLCSGCEYTSRYYGFEGVVQHYAAKHTTALSVGNVVVYWRAEWPKAAPFQSEPRPAKPPQYQPGSAPFPAQYAYGPYQANVSPALQAPPPPLPPPQAQATGYGGVPMPPYGAPPYPPEPYQAPQLQPPYPPPNGYAQPPPGYGPTHYQPAPVPYPAYPGPAAPTGPYQQPAPPSAPVPVQTPAPAPTAPYNPNYGGYQTNAGYNLPPGPGPSHPERYRAQLEDVAKNARELWSATANIKDLPGSGRLQVVFHHLAKRFHATFAEMLPLTMFIDGLSNNKDMRPVRNVNGLVCKTCHLANPVHAAPYSKERKSFSLPQLANHFQTAHVESSVNMGHYGSIPNWTTDMILLPDMSGMSGLRNVIGNDSSKHYLFSEALPQLFQTQVGGLQSTETIPYHDSVQSQWPGPVPQNAIPPPPPAQQQQQQQQQPLSIDNHERFYNSGTGSSMNGASSHPGAKNNVSTNGARKNHFGDGGRKTSTGYQQNHSHQSHDGGKNKKKKLASKGRNPNGPRKADDESSNRGGAHGKKGKGAGDDPEAKYAEEEQRRQEEEIRAMWAADRAQTARQQTTTEAAPSTLATSDAAGQKLPETVPADHAPTPRSPQRPSRQPQAERVAATFNKSSNPPLPQSQPSQPYEHLPLSRRVPSHQQPPSRPDREGSDPLAALELYLDEERKRASGAAQNPQPPPPPPANKVIYMDDYRATGPQEAREPYPRYASARPLEERRRSATPPGYARYLQHPPASDQYRDRSPPPRPSYPGLSRQPDSLYHSRSVSYHPAEEVSYERVSAPPPREYYRVYAGDDRRHARPAEHEQYESYETYEVIVQHPDGDYLVRRPVIRHERDREWALGAARDGEPPLPVSEAERYYVADRYERERPLERAHIPPPARREVDAYTQPYEQRIGPASSAYGSLYREALPPQHQQYQQPQPQMYETHGANPAVRGEPAASRPHISRADPAYYEEYDPRFPAAPPPRAPSVARQSRY